MNYQELHKARLSHRFKRGILGVLYGIFVLVLLINSLLQTSMLQNFLAHKASELLSKELGVEVNIEKIHLSLMMDITMQGVTMKDFHHNEMVKADYLYVAIEGIDIRKLKFSLTQLRLENSGFVLRKYENEEHYNISMVFPSDTTDTTAFIFPANITCGNAQLKNCFFQLINDQKNIKEDGFDYNHIDLKIETLKADKILISDDEYSFKVKQLQVRDTSGFCVEEMTTWMKFLPDGWYMDQLQLKTPSSHLDMDLKLAYSTFDNIGEFIDSVRIISEIRPSVLDVQDIAYFTESLKKYSVTAGLEGKVDGWVNDLQIEELKINVAENTAIDVSAYLRGIMNPESAFMNIKLDYLATTLTDLQSMESIFGAINIPKGVMDEMELSGSFKGTLNDFDATAIGKATCGAVNTHVKMWKDPYFDDYQYYGFFVASDLHTTSEMGWEDEYKVQEVFLNFEGFGTSLENVKMELNGEIDRINAFGYEYDTLLVKGVLSKKMFQGNIDLNDKNIGLNFSGMVTLDTESPVFDFSTSIKNGYLARLGLLPSRADDAHLSLDMSMKLKGEDLDHLLGLVELNDVVWVENDSVYNFNDLKIGTYEQMSGNRKIVLRSPMMDANVEGDFLLTELDQVMDYFSSIYIPSYESLMQEDTITDIYDGYDLEWDLSLKDITPLTRLLIPELKIPYGMYINGLLDLEDSVFSINGQSPRIEYKNFAGENWSFSNDAQKTNVTLNTGFQRLVLIPPDADDTMGMVRHDFLLTLEMYHGIVDYDVMWDNFSNDTLHYFLKGLCDLTKYPETNFKITDMQAPFQQSLWDIADDNYIKIDTNKNIEIHNIHFFSDSSYLKMNGFFAQDSLSKTEVLIDISNLDLSMVNFLLDDYETEIKGVVSGSADFEKENNSLSFISDVEIDQLWINDNKMGDMILLSQWDPEKNAISLKVESSITNVYGKVTYPLQIEGYIKPDDENDFFDLSMNLNNIRLAILDPFIHDFVEQTSGFLTGNAVLKGSLKEPKLKASIEMNRCEALIKYTNVLYFFDGSIDVDEQMISFHNLVVSDSMQGTAMIEGGIKHRTFSDFNLDLKLKTSEFKILNTNRIQNDIFYGKAIVSGDINVFGPINDINISAFVRTNQGTDMSIPISSAMSVDENTYVIFKLPPSDSLKANKMKSSIMGLTLSLRMMMTPEGQVRIYLPGDVGNLVANGNGLITLGLNKRGDFSLSGTYILDGGRFLLNLENIISKKFEINKGSSITFNGDPMDAILNVSATYGTRTTLMGLGIALDSTLLKQRTNVDCILRMTDELSDPQISFSIDFPGQSEDFKQTVFSQLDTTNEVLMTQQAFSLLVVNSFSLNTTGTSLGSTMASSGVSMLTNQINGWLSQLSKDVNIGINYRPGDKLSSDEIGVALSTQLFNNRVTIDANVGYSGHSATSNRASSVVGDVSVEVKITKDGRFSTKVFSRSNANDISKIGTNSEQGYTYGVGLNYRKNFDKFSEIFSRTPEQKRQRALKKETKKASKKNDILET